MPRSPRKPTTFFTTSSNPGTERSVCRAARSAECSQVTGAIPVRTLRGRGAGGGALVGSVMDTSVENPRLYVARASEFPYCGLWIADWLPAPRSIRNPKSAIASPERLIEIRDQVLHVLDPDGEPYETVAQPHLVAQRLRDARVRHRGGVPDQALHAAQRLGQREDPGALDEAPRPLQAPELQADHAAEPFHLAAGELVLRMRRQAGVIDPLHLGMVREPLGDAASVDVVLTHAEPPSLGAAQRQPAAERPRHAARRVLDEPDALGQVVAVHDQHPPHHVAVAVQVLGGRVQHDVGTELERALEAGRGEGVVHD